MAELKIRVSAAADPSLKTAFRPLEDAARRAGESVKRAATTSERAQRQAGKEGERAANQQAAAARRVEAELAKLAAREVAAASRAADAAVKAEQKKTSAAMREFDKRLRKAQQAYAEEERGIMRVAQAAERAEQKKANAAQRAARSQSRTQDTGTRTMQREFASRAVANVGATTRAGLAVGRDVARGLGVDFSLGNSIERNVEFQRRVTELSNQGFNPSEGKARIAPSEIAAQIKSATDATGFGRLQGTEGLNAFVAKTGDLQTGLNLLKDLGMVAKASGSDLNDLASAAGDAYSALGDDMSAEQKTKRVSDIMRVLAGQGKIGAVEIGDLATQMAKLGTSATAFQGDPSRNMAFMGALAQMSRKTGGSASATQAATSVSAFVNTLRTPARMKAFQNAGVDILDKQTGEFRDPEQIILASLAKTQADPEQWKKLFANVQGARAVEGAATIYRRSRAAALNGGASEDEANVAGLQSVKGEFDRFRKIAMGDAELKESFGMRMGNDDSKAQLAQNRLDDVAERMGQKLVPALEKLEPHVLKLAEAFASMVSWAAENPGKAIVGAVVLGVGKAFAEVSFMKLAERAFAGGGGGGKPGAGGATGAAGGMGNLAAGLTIAAAAVTITAAGVQLIDEGFKAREAADAAQRTSANSAQETGTNAVIAARSGTITTEQIAALEAELARVEGDIARGETAAGKSKWNPLASQANAASGALNFITAGSIGESFDKQSADQAAGRALEQNRAQHAELVRQLAAVRDAVAANAVVTVANIGQGLVDQVGRTGGFVGSFFGG